MEVQIEWWKVSDVRSYLNISRCTVYKYVNDKTLKSYRIGNRIRFNKQDVISLVKPA